MDISAFFYCRPSAVAQGDNKNKLHSQPNYFFMRVYYVYILKCNDDLTIQALQIILRNGLRSTRKD
jgi:hypothetical protein